MGKPDWRNTASGTGRPDVVDAAVVTALIDAERALAGFAADVQRSPIWPVFKALEVVREAVHSAALDGAACHLEWLHRRLADEAHGQWSDGERAAWDIHRAIGRWQRVSNDFDDLLVDDLTDLAAMTVRRSWSRDHLPSLEIESCHEGLIRWLERDLPNVQGPDLVAAVDVWRSLALADLGAFPSHRLARIVAPAWIEAAHEALRGGVHLSAASAGKGYRRAVDLGGIAWRTWALGSAAAAARDGRARLRRLESLRENIFEACPGRAKSRRGQVIDWVLANPVFSLNRLAYAVRVSRRAAAQHLERLIAAGFVEEITGGASYRVYSLRDGLLD